MGARGLLGGRGGQFCLEGLGMAELTVRGLAAELSRAALAAVDPGAAVRRALERSAGGRC